MSKQRRIFWPVFLFVLATALLLIPVAANTFAGFTTNSKMTGAPAALLLSYPRVPGDFAHDQQACQRYEDPLITDEATKYSSFLSPLVTNVLYSPVLKLLRSIEGTRTGDTAEGTILNLEIMGSISGTVKDTDGHPLADVSVSAKNDTGNAGYIDRRHR